MTAQDSTINTDAETAAGEMPAAKRPARTYTVRRPVLWSLAFVLVFLMASTGIAGWLLLGQHQRDTSAAQALDTARGYAVMLTTTDPKTIDTNFADILDGATGEFKDTYGKASAQLRKMLIDNKVTTSGSVEDAAVKSMRGDEVDVLLAVKQTVTNAASSDPRTDLVSISITMRKVADHWLAANVVLAGSGVGGDH